MALGSLNLTGGEREVIIVDDSGNRAEVDADSLKNSTYWERISTHFNRIEEENVDSRSTSELINHTGKGFLVGVVVIAKNKSELKLRIQFEDQSTYFDFSPEDVHTYLCTGIGVTTVASGIGLGCNIWNPVLSYYGIIFAPAEPLTYKEHLKVWIYNRSDSTQKILDAWAVWGQIED